MEILKIQVVPGANVYSYRPIIRTVVDLQEWTDITSDSLGDFVSRLLGCLPTLAEHHCGRGKPGGFVERLEEGTLVGHIIEHVTIEMLTLAGQNIPYGKTLSLPGYPGHYEIIFNYDSCEGGIEGFRQGFALVKRLLAGKDPQLAEGLKKIRESIVKDSRGASTTAIIKAASKRGIPIIPLNETSLLQLGYGCHQKRLQAAMTEGTSCLGVDIAGDKFLTNSLLRQSGVPVPYGYLVSSEQEAIEAFSKLRSMAVVKPYNGNQGKGVSMKLKNDQEIRTAFRLAQNYSDQVLVEEYVEGRNYRLLILNGKMIAAAERIPARIMGDGISTIQQLIDRVNASPERGEDHENFLTKVRIDSVVLLTLAQQGLSLDSIPQAEQGVFLRENANLSTGGTAADVTESVHPDNRELAEYAARIIGLNIAGVDLVVGDIEQSYRHQGGAIIEVNASPGLRMHLAPTYGKPIDVGSQIVNAEIPTGNARIPIIAITGTNGKTTTTRMIGKILSDRGLKVGMTTTDGIYLGGKMLVKGDTTGPESAQVVLRHPEVQAAVLETARGGILRAGLGYDYADIAVVTNVTNDHLGQYGVETLEDVAHVKSLVAEVVRPHSYVVLNADDPLVVKMAVKTKGKVVFFSAAKDNLVVRKHLGRGGMAVFVRRGMILLCKGDRVVTVCSVKQLPVTWEGKAQHNTQNALAAIAAGWALGLSAERIRDSLSKFNSDSEDNRGRLNHYRLRGVDVFIDYGHNAAGIREIAQTLKKFKPRSLTGCVTVPGDRPEETLREVARVAAKGFNRLVIREDEDLRGRKPGEVAEILFEEAVRSGMDPRMIKVVLPEREAFCFGLDTCGPGEIFVMFYENLEPIEEEIRVRLALEQVLPQEGTLLLDAAGAEAQG